MIIPGSKLNFVPHLLPDKPLLPGELAQVLNELVKPDLESQRRKILLRLIGVEEVEKGKSTSGTGYLGDNERKGSKPCARERLMG